MAVGEIPTLKTQAKMYRNLIYYELLSDYEYFHLQVQMFFRGLKWQYHRICSCCCRRKSPSMESRQAAYKIDSRYYLNENRHRDNMSRWNKFLFWLKKTFAEEPIQSDIERAKLLNKKDALASLDDDDE